MWAVFKHQRTRNNYPCGHDWNWYKAGYNPSNHLFGKHFPFYLVEALTTQNKKRLCTDDRFSGKIVIEIIILWVKFQTGKIMFVKEVSGDLHCGKSQSKSHNGTCPMSMALYQSQFIRTTYHKEVLTLWHEIFAGFCVFCGFFQWSAKQRKGSAKNISSKNFIANICCTISLPAYFYQVQRTRHGKSYWTV